MITPVLVRPRRRSTIKVCPWHPITHRSPDLWSTIGVKIARGDGEGPVTQPQQTFTVLSKLIAIQFPGDIHCRAKLRPAGCARTI